MMRALSSKFFLALIAITSLAMRAAAQDATTPAMTLESTQHKLLDASPLCMRKFECSRVRSISLVLAGFLVSTDRPVRFNSS